MNFQRLVKKRIAFSLFLLLFLQLYPMPYTLYPTFAADSTPSANIRTKLKELQTEIASKAAKLKQEMNRKLQNKVYIGKVKQKSVTSLTLATRSGAKLVSLNQDTVIPKKKFTEEDYLAALGDVDETGVLIAKKIILLPTPNSELKTYLWGQIISKSNERSSSSSKLATLKTSDLKSIALSLPTNSEAKINDFVIVTGTKGKNDIFNAEFVYVKK